MNLSGEQLKDTYGNLVTTGTTAGSPTTGSLQNGDGDLITQVGVNVTPSATLHVNKSTIGEYLRLGSGNIRQLQFSSFDTASAHAGHDIDASSSNGILTLSTGGTERLRIDSSGNVGINETNPSNKLEVNSGSTQTVSIFKASSTSTTTNNGGALIGIRNTNNTNGNMEGLFFQNSNGSGTSGIIGYNVNHTTNEGLMTFGVRNSSGTFGEKMRIDSSGNLGLGTDSPANDVSGLHISVASSTDQLYLERTGSGTGRYYLGTASNSLLIVDDAQSTERMRIDSSGQVHINGTTSVTTAMSGDNIAPKLIVEDDLATGIGILRQDTSIASGNSLGSFGFYGTDTTSNTPTPLASMQAIASGTHSAGDNPTELRFFVTPDGSSTMNEAVRIDSSGNVLVGKNSVGFATVGCELRANGQITGTKDESASLILNRTTSDGNIAQFYKDGTQAGLIGTIAGFLYVGSNNDTALTFVNNAIRPSRDDGSGRDNAIDLGQSGNRFDDIYATNGTIQTSDRNEKQDIEELNDAELRVAQQAKTLLRKYRWTSSVEENDDDARIHFGIIAQDLEQAFTDEGLDAGRYGMFIKTTWTNEDGEEQTRLGVRYNQLLAFIISAI